MAWHAGQDDESNILSVCEYHRLAATHDESLAQQVGEAGKQPPLRWLFQRIEKLRIHSNQKQDSP